MAFTNIQFILLCLSGFLFFASFNMIIPELPDYLTKMGGEDYKGFIISLFTLAAGLSRPFSGKLTDTIGRIPVMIFGAFVCAACGLLYPFASSVFVFLLLRFFNGLSTGFKPTATAAYIADVVPFNKRGEAMGVLGFFSSLGMAVGPSIGSYIAFYKGIDMMFYSSSLFAFLSVAVLFRMKESLAEKQDFKLSLLKVRFSDSIYKKAFPPSIAMMFLVVPFGVILTFIPDLSRDLHQLNKGIFFIYYTVATIMVRIFAGRLSDQLGRIPVIRMGVTFILIALIFMSQANSISQLNISAFIYGIGTGFSAPTLFAWTIDLSEAAKRGRAFATLYIALEIGIGFGALTSGQINNYLPNNYFYIFLLPLISCIIGAVYLFFMVKRSDDPIRLQKS